MLICRNAEGVHGKRKVGNSCCRVSREILKITGHRRTIDEQELASLPTEGGDRVRGRGLKHAARTWFARAF